MMEDTRKFGMAEADRQLRVAERLHAATRSAAPWRSLSLTEKRPFINQACTPEHRDEDS